MLKILTYADLHGKVPQIPKKYNGNHDVIIILAGDICPHDTDNFTPGIKIGDTFTQMGWRDHWNFRKIDAVKEMAFQNNWIETRLLPQFEMSGIKPSQVIGVAGNHDWATFSKYFENMIETDSKTITIQGVKIGLLCGSIWFTGEWQDEVSEGTVQSRINNIDSEIEILISHQPPYSILDSGHGEDRIGSQSIYTSIFGRSVFDSVKPFFTKLRLHTFGHAHQGRGTKRFTIDNREIRFYNSAETRFDLEFTGEVNG